jgi:elongation factor 2
MPEDKTVKVKELMHQPEKIRNIAIAAHIDHGKTTFSDNLLAGAGMMSEELAGKQLVLDFHEDERTRGITIDAANVSMVHDVEDTDYLINLIDTPGHVDFGGDVTRAMRAVDGCIVLVCASEGVMPQTETVLRQALRERVKPILFINKVDRLIREVKLTPEQMQERFKKIIAHVNELIENIAPEEYKRKWQVNVAEGTVAFGSAVHNWALSASFMEKQGVGFKDIIDIYTKDEKGGEERRTEAAKKAPLHRVILDMVVKHLPNPKEAQPYRIPKIWHGDIESEIGKSLIQCDEKGKPAFVCTKIVIDKHAGEIAAGRLFSGTIKQGQDVYMNQAKKHTRTQQVFIYKGAQRIQMDEVVAGNIVGISGLRGIFAGETVSEEPIEPFEAIKHIFEPVVTKSIEAKNPADLPKLIEVLRQVSKEDPSIFIEINEETGENLMSGMGELHLEIIENRIKTEKDLDVKTSPPIVVYNETVRVASRSFEGRSPNKHNQFFIKVEPLEDNIYQAIKEGEVREGRIKKKDEVLFSKLRELGLSGDEIRQYRHIYKGNVFLDQTRGEVHIGEVMDMVLDAFEQVVDRGPLAREPCMKMKVSLTDIKLHEDAIHRGPAQVYPAVRDALYAAMKDGKVTLFEPVQIHQIEAPVKFLSELTKLVSSKRGQLIDVKQDAANVIIKAKIPVAEMIGWSNDLRSATEGRGISSLMDQMFEKVPSEMQQDVIKKIRSRKGLAENQ